MTMAATDTAFLDCAWLLADPGAFIVWTTTPWTLPANLAIAAHPDVRYAFVTYVRNGNPM